jgi:hypothetical protein
MTRLQYGSCSKTVGSRQLGSQLLISCTSSFKTTMKITATLSFLALLPTIGAQCDFCPSGITEGDATVVPFTNGTTCEQIAMAALTPDLDTSSCASFKTGGHRVCCPADVGPGCDFCPTGVENEDLEDEDGTTCGDFGAL